MIVTNKDEDASVLITIIGSDVEVVKKDLIEAIEHRCLDNGELCLINRVCNGIGKALSCVSIPDARNALRDVYYAIALEPLKQRMNCRRSRSHHTDKLDRAAIFATIGG
jgi:hypothetical protein